MSLDLVPDGAIGASASGREPKLCAPAVVARADRGLSCAGVCAHWAPV
jgi:hypothetical protein